MSWVIVGLIVGLVAAVVLTGLLSRRARSGEPIEQDVDPLFTMGIALVGTGVALVASVGVGMIGILALGLIFMFTGMAKMREKG